MLHKLIDPAMVMIMMIMMNGCTGFGVVQIAHATC